VICTHHEHRISGAGLNNASNLQRKPNGILFAIGDSFTPVLKYSSNLEYSVLLSLPLKESFTAWLAAGRAAKDPIASGKIKTPLLLHL